MLTFAGVYTLGSHTSGCVVFFQLDQTPVDPAVTVNQDAGEALSSEYAHRRAKQERGEVEN